MKLWLVRAWRREALQLLNATFKPINLLAQIESFGLPLIALFLKLFVERPHHEQRISRLRNGCRPGLGAYLEQRRNSAEDSSSRHSDEDCLHPGRHGQTAVLVPK